MMPKETPIQKRSREARNAEIYDHYLAGELTNRQLAFAFDLSLDMIKQIIRTEWRKRHEIHGNH
jgi:hypothetical protein